MGDEGEEEEDAEEEEYIDGEEEEDVDGEGEEDLDEEEGGEGNFWSPGEGYLYSHTNDEEGEEDEGEEKLKLQPGTATAIIMNSTVRKKKSAIADVPDSTFFFVPSIPENFELET